MYKNVSISAAGALALVIPKLALAQPFVNNPITLDIGGNVIDTVPELLLAIVQGALLILTPLIVVFIVYAGFLFVTAQGNEAQLEKAKKTLLWCLIGALLIVGALILSEGIRATVFNIAAPP